MKKILLFSFLIPFCFLIYSFIPFQDSGTDAINNVVVEFITTNHYGNNLFIDNFSIGDRYQNDIAVFSINNINKDTSYSSAGSSAFSVSPNVTFVNLGKTSITTSFNVTLQITQGSYSSTKSIASLASGASVNVVFDPVSISPNTLYNLKVWSSYSADQNHSNDTLTQNTYYKPGGRKSVVYQCFTSSTCSWCAVFNPAMDAFITQKFDTLVAIKYHMNFPSTGDPMYLANTTQNTDRMNYYAVSGIPVAFADGVTSFGGYTLPSLPGPYLARLQKGSPMAITVVDSRVAGDSIRSNITLNIYSALPAGSYVMQVEAIERHIHYATAPGSNGETDFYDVFRRAYPTDAGVTAPTAVGTYNYIYTYKRESNWVDSMMYTSVYIQNNTTKEIINAGKARHYALNDITSNNTNLTSKAPVAISNSYPNLITSTYQTDNIMAGFNNENFESSFPPAGWSIINPDNGFTFEWSPVCNGPTFPGTKTVKMNFYDYASTGQMDYMKTKVYNNIDLSDTLKFDWAYSFISGYNDRLQVKISTDGGVNFPYTIFDKAGSVLATAPSTQYTFVPTSPSDWGSYKIRIGDYITAIHSISGEVPSSYSLNQNYPNPFNPVTNINFALPKSGNVTLKVYDMLGNLVTTLYNGFKPAGYYNTNFDGTNLSSGIYFYQLKADNFIETKKMTLIK